MSGSRSEKELYIHLGGGFSAHGEIEGHARYSNAFLESGAYAKASAPCKALFERISLFANEAYLTSRSAVMYAEGESLQGYGSNAGMEAIEIHSEESSRQLNAMRQEFEMKCLK